MKKTLFTGLVIVALAGAAHATLYTYDFSTGLANGGVIPDGNTAGWSDTRTANLAADFGPLPSGTTTEITDVNVHLSISGGYDGDLYGYLVHSSGFAVLLNRAGRTSGDSYGYGDVGFNLTLDDTGTYGDIHTYQNVSGFGTKIVNGSSWQPDARNVDPATVTDLSSRSAYLSSFNTASANGTWTLFLADLSSGETSTLVSWGLDISVVPEPTTWALIAFGVGFVAVLVFREMRQRARVILPAKYF